MGIQGLWTKSLDIARLDKMQNVFYRNAIEGDPPFAMDLPPYTSAGPPC
jgi:hypothetical protein